MQNKFKTNMTAVETMFNDILPNQRQNLSRENLILDILPFMLDILQPRLRQVKRIRSLKFERFFFLLSFD